MQRSNSVAHFDDYPVVVATNINGTALNDLFRMIATRRDVTVESLVHVAAKSCQPIVPLLEVCERLQKRHTNVWLVGNSRRCFVSVCNTALNVRYVQRGTVGYVYYTHKNVRKLYIDHDTSVDKTYKLLKAVKSLVGCATHVQYGRDTYWTLGS